MLIPPPFESYQLYQAIEGLKEVSWHDSIEKDALTVLLANEINKYTSQELEAITNKRNRDNIFRLIISKKNHYLFGLLLEKGAFKDKIFECSQFVLNHVKEMTLEQYRTLLIVETHEKAETTSYFFLSLEDLCKDNIELFEKIITYYKEKYFDYINNYIYYNPTDNIFKNTAMKVLHENNIYPSINYLLINKKTPNFNYIHSYHIEKIEKLLKLGYKIEEDNYKDKTILTMLLESQNAKLVELLLPYLKNVIPVDRTLEEQTQLLEQYKSEENYSTIASKYNYLILNATLNSKVNKKSFKL